MEDGAGTGEPGAYVLAIDLGRVLRMETGRLSGAVLPPGRYLYCGNAHGPGGLRARLRRHLRRGKTPRWHVDRLSEAGRVVAVGLRLGGRECDLLARLRRLPGVRVPIAGFGSSDCRVCPAHLVRAPEGLALAEIAAALSLDALVAPASLVPSAGAQPALRAGLSMIAPEDGPEDALETGPGLS